MGYGRSGRYIKPPLGVQLDFSHHLAQGLVGCWLFNEGAGGRLIALTPNRNHGTLRNGPAWRGGRRNQALSFDGVDDFVTGPRPTQITSSSAVAVSISARLDQAPALVNLFNLNDGTNSILLGYWFNASNGFLLQSGSVTSNTTRPSLDRDITQWHHWVFQRSDNSSRPQIYIDGVNMSENDPNSLSNVVVDAFELSRGLDGGFQAKMTVGEVRIYNRALLPDEVAELARAEYAEFLWPATRRYFVPVIGGAQVRRGVLHRVYDGMLRRIA